MQDKAEWSPSTLEEEEQGSPVPIKSHKSQSYFTEALGPL